MIDFERSWAGRPDAPRRQRRTVGASAPVVGALAALALVTLVVGV